MQEKYDSLTVGLQCDEVHPQCSNCLKYDLECEYPPEKPSSSLSRGTSPKPFPLKKIASNENNPTYLSPYTAAGPSQCKTCQQLQAAGALSQDGAGSASQAEFHAQHMAESRALEAAAGQSMGNPNDRLLELRLMHRKYHQSLISTRDAREFSFDPQPLSP